MKTSKELRETTLPLDSYGVNGGKDVLLRAMILWQKECACQLAEIKELLEQRGEK